MIVCVFALKHKFNCKLMEPCDKAAGIQNKSCNKYQTRHEDNNSKYIDINCCPGHSGAISLLLSQSPAPAPTPARPPCSHTPSSFLAMTPSLSLASKKNDRKPDVSACLLCMQRIIQLTHRMCALLFMLLPLLLVAVAGCRLLVASCRFVC